MTRARFDINLIFSFWENITLNNELNLVEKRENLATVVTLI